MAEARAAVGTLAAGLGRAFGGALIFGLPMLMTNELWELGATMDRLRLALLLLLGIPLLVGVSHRIGFEASFGWREDLRDAAIALGVGLVAATADPRALQPARPRALGRRAGRAGRGAGGARGARGAARAQPVRRRPRARSARPSPATAARCS